MYQPFWQLQLESGHSRIVALHPGLVECFAQQDRGLVNVRLIVGSSVDHSVAPCLDPIVVLVQAQVKHSLQLGYWLPTNLGRNFTSKLYLSARCGREQGVRLRFMHPLRQTRAQQENNAMIVACSVRPAPYPAQFAGSGEAAAGAFHL